jgi:hypothetical protein
MTNIRLRLLDSLHQEATNAASITGKSLNSWFIEAIEFALKGGTIDTHVSVKAINKPESDGTIDGTTGDKCELCNQIKEVHYEHDYERGESHPVCFECAAKKGKVFASVWSKLPNHL